MLASGWWSLSLQSHELGKQQKTDKDHNQTEQWPIVCLVGARRSGPTGFPGWSGPSVNRSRCAALGTLVAFYRHASGFCSPGKANWGTMLFKAGCTLPLMSLVSQGNVAWLAKHWDGWKPISNLASVFYQTNVSGVMSDGQSLNTTTLSDVAHLLIISLLLVVSLWALSCMEYLLCLGRVNSFACAIPWSSAPWGCSPSCFTQEEIKQKKRGKGQILLSTFHFQGF